MTDQLLPYYQRELDFFRRMGRQFAERHPKLAARLRLGPDTCEDPHVERMIEAFAYLNARIRHKLDDDFPELTDAMLGIVYPHYLAPIPSTAIVQLVLDPAQGKLTSGYQVAAGTTIETEPIAGDPCRFRTAYPVTLWPIELEQVELLPRPFRAPRFAGSGDAAAVLRLVLRTAAEDVPFAKLNVSTLRFFLQGQGRHTHALYEILLNNTLAVAMAASAEDAQPTVCPRTCVRPVGFEADEGLVPYSARSFLGYRLLTEYFVFPEKFLFVDVSGIDAALRARAGRKLEIYFYLNRTVPDLEQNVSREMLRLGCTPMVNLFRQRAEPIRLTQTQSDYRVVPDARRPLVMEIYSIDRVTGTSPDGHAQELAPFYSQKHGGDRREQRWFWHAVRRAADEYGVTDQGTEMAVSVVDLDLRLDQPADWTLDLETTCTNRDLPRRLPFGGDQPRLRLEQGGPISRVLCLTPPTATFRPPLRRGAMWRLISHLTVNHLSLGNDETATEALREILRLYDFSDSAQTRAMIDGVLALRSWPVVGRIGRGRQSGIARGMEIGLELDEERFSGSGVYLFASVLERFLGLYCNVNSFTRLVLRTRQREGDLCRWPARSGERVLV